MRLLIVYLLLVWIIKFKRKLVQYAPFTLIFLVVLIKQMTRVAVDFVEDLVHRVRSVDPHEVEVDRMQNDPLALVEDLRVVCILSFLVKRRLRLVVLLEVDLVFDFRKEPHRPDLAVVRPERPEREEQEVAQLLAKEYK